MKKIILFSMVLCIVLASLPTITFAATNVGTFDELSAALTSAGGSTIGAPKIITVTADITITSEIALGAGYYTLISDNSDHTITRGNNTVINMFKVNTASSGLNIGEATPSTTGKLTFDSNTNASSQVTAGSIIYSSKILNIYSGTFKNMNGTGVSAAIVSASGSTLSNVNNATFTNNATTGSGAAINYAGTGAVSISGSTFTSNTATTDGGAIYSTGALTLDGGTSFTTCSAGRGGAIASKNRIDLKTVTIDSCSSTGNIDYGGGAILGLSGCSLFIYDGATIRSCTSVKSGGAISVKNVGVPVTMSGGSIQSCTTQAGGGAYFNDYGSATASTFTMTGGTISGCSAVNGGAINSASTINVSGGLITGCSASQFGGVASGKGTFTFSGGTISGCTATAGGGVIGNTNGEIKFEITGNALIDGCKATGTNANGGVFNCANNTTTNYFKMTGGRIANCEATGNGGAVNAANVNTVLISDGIIENCKAANGGALTLTITNATISGGTIRNCTAIGATGVTGMGGAIAQNEQNTSSGTITITGGTISGCSAPNGAAIATTNPMINTNFNLNINGGAINNCIPTTEGNSTIFWQGKILSLNGGTMSGCAEKAIYVNYDNSGTFNSTTYYGGLNLGVDYTLSHPHRIVFATTGKFATISADMNSSDVATLEGADGQTVLSGAAAAANVGKFEGYVNGTACGINGSGVIDTLLPSPRGGAPIITEITGITGNATTGYTVNFTLATDIDPTACIIIALYDSSDNLVGVNATLTTADTTVSIPVTKTAVTAKLMVWDNLTNIKPLIDVVPSNI